MTNTSHGGMINNHGKFSQINSGPAIPTFDTGQVVTIKKQL